MQFSFFRLRKLDAIEKATREFAVRIGQLVLGKHRRAIPLTPLLREEKPPRASGR